MSIKKILLIGFAILILLTTQSFGGDIISCDGFEDCPAAVRAPEGNWLLSLTIPNGDGTESSSNAWTTSSFFIYRGTSVDPSPSSAIALMYTTNSNTYYKVRIYDQTNGSVIAVSLPHNEGTVGDPSVLSLGAISNLPPGISVFEVQILATDFTGVTGIAGRQAIGIHTFQMW